MSSGSYSPSQFQPYAFPSTICTVAPSVAITFQTCIACRCHGMLTSSTCMPASRSRSAAARTVWSTRSSDRSGMPNPSLTTPARSPVTSWLRAAT